MSQEQDLVNHPPHYKSHPSGVECITITEHFNFCRGNAIKYIWRAGEKDSEIKDLKKAAWYINREIKRLEAVSKPACSGKAESQPQFMHNGVGIADMYSPDEFEIALQRTTPDHFPDVGNMIETTTIK
jgi:hypothetical protein